MPSVHSHRSGPGPSDDHARPDAVTLVTRPGCPSCGAAGSEPVWTERFDAEVLRDWWERTGYEADVASLLAGESFELVECVDCAMRYQRRVLAEPDIRALYSTWISSTQVDRCMHLLAGDDPSAAAFDASRHAVRRLLVLRRLVAGGGAAPPRLLDFGCGDGGFVGLAAEFGFEAHGVDFSASRRRRAEARGLALVPDLDHWNRNRLGQVDAVTMIEVLEHLVDPVAALREVATVLEPGGVLLIEVPDCSGIDTPGDFGEFNHLNPLEHVNAFVPATLERLCSRVGFEPARRPPVFVTPGLVGVARAVAESMVRQRSTRRYFRLVRP